MTLIQALAFIYKDVPITFPQLRAVTLAQWLLESGRGTSPLAQQFYNFGGLKWRAEMQGFAVPVWYDAHDGRDLYCAFESLGAYCRGYWRFLGRSPYAGWQQHAHDPAAFIRFIGGIYAPANPIYADHVLRLMPEAQQLLGAGVPV